MPIDLTDAEVRECATAQTEISDAAWAHHGAGWRRDICGSQLLGNANAYAKAAEIVARRQTETPANEQLCPWERNGSSWIRRPAENHINDHAIDAVASSGYWCIFKHSKSSVCVADGRAASLKAAMSAADAAARALGYVLTDAPDTPLSLAVTVPRTLPGIVDDAHSTCSQHRTRFLATSYCAGCAILRDALDALLRFLLGLPQGAQWMGAERWRALALHGSDWMRKGGDGRTTLEPEDLATRLLASLGDVPACATARWLTVAEQREYEGLRMAVIGALR